MENQYRSVHRWQVERGLLSLLLHWLLLLTCKHLAVTRTIVHRYMGIPIKVKKL